MIRRHLSWPIGCLRFVMHYMLHFLSGVLHCPTDFRLPVMWTAYWWALRSFEEYIVKSDSTKISRADDVDELRVDVGDR